MPKGTFMIPLGKAESALAKVYLSSVNIYIPISN